MAQQPLSLHGYAFGQISRPVRIVSTCAGCEVTEQLTGDRFDNDVRESSIRYLDEVVEHRIACTPNADDVSAAASEFCRPRQYVRARAVVGRQDQAGRARFHQSDDAVLQLARGEALGMDVARFFDLQGCLQCRGVVRTATDHEEMLRRGQSICDLLDPSVATAYQ